MRDTTSKGDLAELEVAMALMRAGRKVLRPFSTGLRYDLVIDDGQRRFTRIQCKMGILRDGAVQFRLYSVNVSRRFVPRTYRGEVDAFGVYCPQTEACYLVPMSELSANAAFACLRTEPARNGQAAGIRLASDYMIRASGSGPSEAPTPG